MVLAAKSFCYIVPSLMSVSLVFVVEVPSSFLVCLYVLVHVRIFW